MSWARVWSHRNAAHQRGASRLETARYLLHRRGIDASRDLAPSRPARCFERAGCVPATSDRAEADQAACPPYEPAQGRRGPSPESDRSNSAKPSSYRIASCLWVWSSRYPAVEVRCQFSGHVRSRSYSKWNAHTNSTAFRSVSFDTSQYSAVVPMCRWPISFRTVHIPQLKPRTHMV
jgi:hypothetical protein